MKPLSQQISDHIIRLDTPLYCTLSTIDVEGNVWGAPVYFAHDEEGNLYWSSGIDTQHSQNITANKNIFITLFKEGMPWATGDTFGLYMRGTACALESLDEVIVAREILSKKAGVASTYPEKFLGDTPRRVYKFTPEKAWTNNTEMLTTPDGGRHPTDYRMELDTFKK